jgi:guanine deaminase
MTSRPGPDAAAGVMALRAAILHCLDDPGDGSDHVEYFEDGLLVLADGRIERLLPASAGLRELPESVPVHDLRGRLIVPGFVDCHVHYPQVDVVASYGEKLLDWLEHYTFPVEARFSDPELARQTAEFFIDELLRNGTTTALVFCTVHPQSADAIFEAALARNMRLGAGKVLMDRHCPAELRDTPESGYRDSRELIERWHGRGRLHYAITPRFAPTSTAEQLTLAGQLARECPDVHVHTHLAENDAECRWVSELFPDARSYLDVYRRCGLVRERSVFAHAIHIDDEDRACLCADGAAIAFCPTSNLFLGSGLFDLGAARAAGVALGLGTDIGGGTSFSLAQTAAEAYRVAQLRGQTLTPFQAFYRCTLGGARALGMERWIGSFRAGREADLVVLDPSATPLLERRMRAATSIGERLFALLVLADDRVVESTWVAGRPLHRRHGGVERPA